MTDVSSTEEARRPTPTLRFLALRGTFWSLGGHGFSAAIRLSGHLVITRLLDPKLFGIMALVRVAMHGLEMFSDMGVVRSVVRHPKGGEPDFLHTAWTFQVLRGVILCIASCALAWPIALFYEQPDLSWCIPFAGCSALILSFNSINLLSASRRLELGRIKVIEWTAQATGVVAMIICAWITGSILALVLGGVIGASVHLILSHTVMPGLPCRFGWEAEARRELLGFGKWIFFSSVITFLASQLDRIALGRLASEEELGFYWIAAMLSGLVSMMAHKVWDAVLFPVISKKRLAGELDARWVLRLRSSALAASAIPTATVFILAQPLITIAYDSRYQTVAPLVAMFLIGDWITMLITSYDSLLLAAGRPKYKTYGTAVKAALVAMLIWPIYQNFGTLGVALMASLSQLGVLGVCMIGAWKMGMASPITDIMVTLSAVAAGFVLHLVYQGVYAASNSAHLAIAVVCMFSAVGSGVLVKKLLAPQAMPHK